MSSFSGEVFAGVAPPLAMTGMAAVIGVYSGVRRGAGPGVARAFSVVGILTALGLIFFESYRTRTNGVGDFVTSPGSSTLAPGALTIDRFTTYGGVVICGVALACALLSEWVTRHHPRSSGAYHASLLVAASAGYMLLAQHDMTTLVPSVVALVVAAGVLGATARTSKRSIESALNTFVILGVALVLLTYGLAMVYGVTGSTDTLALTQAFSHSPVLSIVGVTFTLLGLFGLAGVLPVHRWVIDVAEGAPAAAAAAIVALVVIPVTIAAVRLGVAWGAHVWWWRGITGGIIAFGAVYAGLMAARQSSVRGLIGYTLSGQTAIGVAGLVAVGPGITGTDSGGATSMLFQALVLAITIVAAFAAIAAAEDAGIADSLKSYRGLADRLGARGVSASLGIAAVIGLPPFGLFVAHLLEWEAAMTSGYAWLVVLLGAASVLLALPAARLTADVFSHEGDPGVVGVGVGTGGAGVSVLGRVALALVCLAPLLVIALLQPLVMFASNAAGVITGG